PRDAEDAYLDGEFVEHVKHPPGAAPAAVFERRLGERHAHSAIGRHADVVEHALGNFIAVEQRRLAAALDVEIEVHGDQRAARPFRIGRRRAVADQIARDHRIRFCFGHGGLTWFVGWASPWLGAYAWAKS